MAGVGEARGLGAPPGPVARSVLGPSESERLHTDAEVVEKPAKEETVVENATPDYAAGLVSTQVGPAAGHPPTAATLPQLQVLGWWLHRKRVHM